MVAVITQNDSPTTGHEASTFLRENGEKQTRIEMFGGHFVYMTYILSFWVDIEITYYAGMRI